MLSGPEHTAGNHGDSGQRRKGQHAGAKPACVDPSVRESADEQSEQDGRQHRDRETTVQDSDFTRYSERCDRQYRSDEKRRA